jgi:hypothetical protein
MANRQFQQFRYSLEKGVVDLYAKVTFGASGAPTLTYGKGISSVAGGAAASATGTFTFTLQDTYIRLLKADITSVLASGYQAAPVLQITADNSATASSKTVVVKLSNAADNTATDPASGEVVLFHFTLSNSSAL